MRPSFEIAMEVAEEIALFRVVNTNPDVPFHKVERWSIDRQKLRREIEHKFTPAQLTFMTCDLFNEILGETEVVLRSRLHGDGFNS